MRPIWTSLFIFLSFSITGYFLVWGGIEHLADGFRLSKISSNTPYSKAYEIPSPPIDHVKKILSQNFSYFGKGSQCYVFESADGQYVLKFFRYPRYRLPWFAEHLSLPTFLSELQHQHLQEKQKKLDDLFISCKIAFQELFEESGLVFLHLNKTPFLLNQTVLLHDNLNRSYSIDIDHYEFLIQKKGELIYPYLNKLILEGAQNKAKDALTDLVSILVRRLQKGIVDNDAVIYKNSGFRNEKAQYLDVGQFKKDPNVKNTKVYNNEIRKITHALHSWLQGKDQELALYLDDLLKE